MGNKTKEGVKGVARKSYQGLMDAAQIFDDIFAEHQNWYMSHSKVSLAMMMERETLNERCTWAARVLRERAAQQERGTP